MKRLIGLWLAAVLIGCGGGATPPPAATTAEVQKRALERVKTIEDQVAAGEVQARDVQALITSMNYLAGHATTEKVGTEAQICQVRLLIAELSQKSQGRSVPPADWKPSDKQAPSASSGIDMEALKEILPRIREAIDAVK